MVSGRQDASTITGGVAAEESVSGFSVVSVVSGGLGWTRLRRHKIAQVEHCLAAEDVR
jgi:hypothetical protein